MDTNIEIENAASISNLPEEVLMDIFEFLKTQDRNNARLVCRLWFRILRRSSFTTIEAFFFPEYFDFSKIEELIEECGRDELNLKFRDRRILEDSEFFWQRCGNNIKSLNFHHCSFHPDALLQIFNNCINLEEFITSGTCEISEKNHRSKLTRKSFRQCNVNNLLREKLLILEFGSLPLTKSDLLCIASIFPNLKKLGIKLARNLNKNFSLLQNLIETKLQHIETLSICLSNCNFPKDVDSLERFISSNSTLEISWALRMKSELFIENNIRQVSVCKCLTSLELRGDMYGHLPLLIRFLGENLMLKYLHFTLSTSEISDFSGIWSALMNSRLICLEVNLGWSSQLLRSSVRAIDSILDGLERNYTVRHLTVHDIHGDKLNFLFSKYFQGVVGLETRQAEPLTIFQNQTQIRSIKISTVTSRSMITSPTSVQSIEYMDIGDNAVEMFSRHRFPNLMYLTVGFRENSYRNKCDRIFPRKNMSDLLNDDLQSLASILLLYSPKLRGVHLSTGVVDTNMKPFECFLQFCRNFSNLHYIYLTSATREEPKQSDMMQAVIDLVNQSSSVKVVWIQATFFKILYVLNPMTGKYEFLNDYDKTFGKFKLTLKDAWEEKH